MRTRASLNCGSPVGPPAGRRVRGLPWALAALAVIASGCASGVVTQLDGVRIAPQVLLAGAPLDVAPEANPDADEVDILAVSPEMRSFLDSNVHRRAGVNVRLQELIDALIDNDTFGLEFDSDTRTAAETFRLRRGNCLSFSNLFVALAREVGLEASFQEVDLPPDWSLDSGVFVLNRHVNVHLDLGELGDHVVDFNIEDFRSSDETRLISDDRARAHFGNNKGVEFMQAGETAAAFAAFRAALRTSSHEFSPAWTNLGTLYMRAGHADFAEACYLRALDVDDGDAVAMSNLQRLYESRGDSRRAEVLRRAVERHRNQNPYYRYHLARLAFADGDYEAAIRHLRFAVRRKNDDRFLYLLGMSYLEAGNRRLGREYLARAEKVAASEELQRGDSSTIERLLSDAH